ncbi:hypothetical protein QAD02_010506 [Eretmocerus hayati]|uniref:Uncharacterized protein n=1 Tax=Eretmocerus hayati TaxID=131215 RepID=A0ACC2NU48_9HYME|nr:hypothetical protein QAD02_010506 [Eretmocerus hayati]
MRGGVAPGLRSQPETVRAKDPGGVERARKEVIVERRRASRKVRGLRRNWIIQRKREVVLSKNKGRKEKEKKRKKEKEDEENEHEDGVDDERRSMSVDKRISSSENESENEVESENGSVSRVREELFGCLFAERSKLGKAECREIISKFAKMEELLNEERRHTAMLEGRLDESRRERLHLWNSLAAQTIIERNMREGACKTGEIKGIQAKQGAVTPGQAQVPAPPPPPPAPVTQGGKTKNRGVPAPRPPSAPSYALVLKQAAGVSDQDALARVKKCVLENKNPRVPRPKLIIFDIPNELLGDGLAEEIRGRNFPEMAPETFRDQVQVVTTVAQRKEAKKKGGENGELSNVVLEVSVKMRERMLKEGKVFVGWVCSKVRESVNVPRCWKCMEYGHSIDECKKKERLCRRCGRPGHLMVAYRDVKRCVNCAK